MRSVSNNRLRREIAHEAAKLVANDGLQDFLQAKKKAAGKLGIHDNRMLPSNSEIETALIEYQSLFLQKEQTKSLHELRDVAFNAMQLFAKYKPLLTGSVLHGTANQHSEIVLHLFSDTPELIGLELEQKGIPAQLCERRLQISKNNPEYFTSFKFLAGDANIVITILPLNLINTPPFDPVSSRPMKRATLNEVKDLINT